ncbi:MerR family transcriptional regulator [Ruminococcus albus]|uniref:DNA-binding transcriptional regulator, MerR family n=1 Tax=Ruminococcus albus TaxID=1264 RepID=A0A1H7MFT3_RUMAL|nr:MerR family transcriptional regulator [Ruminococcus albus]SEL09565.1 DNA-binding transcriptional regulator, MerR family [Ruminococcus albus]
MYTRGQFAVMGSVGIKALRLYHEEGLLVPAYINKENGYHFYEEKQLAVLQKIKNYRKIGMSLFEIRQILDGMADEAEIIESKINETDRLLSEMKAYKKETEYDDTETNAEQIDCKPFGKCRCIFVRENTERENLGMSVGKLYERAAREGITIAGAHFVIFDKLDTDDSFNMTTFLPVSNYTGENVLEVYEENCIHINFKGGFSKVSKAHQMLRKYAEENSIKPTERIYEVYNKDMSVDVYYSKRH